MLRWLILMAVAAPLCAFPAQPHQDVRIETNVVYGMYSGLALLLDVHVPAKPNGRGVVFISGSGWQSGLDYGAAPLKQQQVGLWGPPLLEAGYTVFAINHRAAPRFHHPAAVEDVQRAIRYVRHHAGRYGIDARRIGGVGGSSGGHLIALAAMLAAPGTAADADPVNREDATLQAIVLRAPLTDLRNVGTVAGMAYVVSFMEAPPSNASASAAYALASPVTHVNPRSPPVLLLHGDADDLVPVSQSVTLQRALAAAKVPVELILIPGGAHAADFGAAQPRPDWPNYFAATVGWLDRHLHAQAQ